MKPTPLTDKFISEFQEYLEFKWDNVVEKLDTFNSFLDESIGNIPKLRHEILESIPALNDIPAYIKVYRVKFAGCWSILDETHRWYRRHFSNYLEKLILDEKLPKEKKRYCDDKLEEALEKSFEFFERLSWFFEELKDYIDYQDDSTSIDELIPKSLIPTTATKNQIFEFWKKLAPYFPNEMDDLKKFVRQTFIIDNKGFSGERILLKVKPENHYNTEIRKADIYHLMYWFSVKCLPRGSRIKCASALKNSFEIFIDTNLDTINSGLRDYGEDKNVRWGTTTKDLSNVFANIPKSQDSTQ